MIAKARRFGAVGFVGLFLGAVLAVVVIAPEFGVLTPDTKPELYINPLASLRDYAWPWQDNPGMGSPSFNVGLTPVALVVWLLEVLGAEPWLAARLLRLSLLLLAGLGMVLLSRRIPAIARWRWGPIGAAILFVANPYTVTAGATLPVLLPMATLPWLGYFFVCGLLEPQSWRWPAAFGLAFACGSGMNAGVIPLLQLAAIPGLVVLARAVAHAPGRVVLRMLTLSGAFTLLLSLYWIVPTLGALGAGGTVTANTETLEGIFNPASFAESIRGLGLWPLYGGDHRGPWQPGFAPYLTNGAVIVASFLIPAIILGVAAWASAGLKRAGALMLCAIIFMAGGFPLTRPSPFGSVLTSVFDMVPAASAFRTTNKMGSVLVMGLSLLGAAGLSALAPRVSRQPTRLLVAASGVLVVLVGIASAPMWTGGLYIARFDVPAYWHSASRYLDRAPDNERVWLVPGERLANYRWGDPSPDDLGRALFRSPTVVRTTVPNGSAEAANLLAAADLSTTQEQSGPGVLRAYARLLGAGHIVARNDLDWQDAGGPSPLQVRSSLTGAIGIVPDRAFGRVGENTTAPGGDSSLDSLLPPVQVYSVLDPTPIVRAVELAGQVLVSGDGFSVRRLSESGLLADGHVLAYLGGLSPQGFAQSLRDGARIVLTDTNRRRENLTERLTGSQGPLLSRSTPVSSSLALFAPADQTAVRVDGGSATATEVGSAAGTSADAAPENAFDGDPATSWQFAGFESDVHQSVTRVFDEPIRLDRVEVQTAHLGPRGIARVVLTAGGATRPAEVGADGKAAVSFDGVVATSLRVEATEPRGGGQNRVGISEVVTGAAPLVRTAVLPTTLDRLVSGLDPAGEQDLHQTPIDVLLRRESGLGGAAGEEQQLIREFTLPDQRNFLVSARVRPGAAVSDSDFDLLAGYSTAVTAVGSSRAFDLPTLRGSQALDGNRDTAWVPGAPLAGQTLRVHSTEPTALDHVTVTQVEPAGAPVSTWADHATVLVDGRRAGGGPLARGTSTIRFPEVHGSTIEMRLDSVANESGKPEAVRISEVDLGGLRMAPGHVRRCINLLAVDGRVVAMRPREPITTMDPAPWVTCRGEGLVMGSGGHAVRGITAWSVDTLELHDARGLGLGPPAEAPTTRVVRHDPTKYTVTTSTSTRPYAVVLGQGWNAGWVATMDGRTLPPPTVVDGFSMSWRVDDFTRPHTLELVYQPRQKSLLALGVSSLAVLSAGAVALRPPAHRPLVRAPDVAPLAARPPATARSSARRVSRGSRRPRRPPPLVIAAGIAIAGLVLGGPIGLLLGLLVAGIRVSLNLAARYWFWSAAAVMGTVPVLWLVGNFSRKGQVTPDLVSHNLAPHYATLLVLLCVVAGAVAARDEDDDPVDMEVSG